ncbi:MAG TPA: family 1 encapsulin nanocompartment shell protein [Polyangiaceae bacterium]|nr:family 1 encapsulin nanocompartment shell protein [Polyangiaceae bacterium]
MNDLLKREHAPITPEAWEQVDDEARRVLKLHLAGRKVVDFSGPHGWTLGGINTGRLKVIEKGPVPGVSHAVRGVQPLVELRSPFVMKILELDYAARGARDLDLDPVIAVAERVARAEDDAIFHGFKDGRIIGIVEATPHSPIDVKTNLEWPRAVAAAKEVLRAAGVNGPYALALGIQAFTELAADSEDGYPLRRRIEENLVDGSLVWAPALRGGAVLLSTRGGDFELTVGQDLAIGYAVHDRDEVELYLTESFTFRVLEEKAAIFLRRAGGSAGRRGRLVSS